MDNLTNDIMKDLNIQQFIDIARKQHNVEMTNKEVELIMGYVGGHGYSIKIDNEKQTYLEFYEDVEKEELKEIIYRVLEWNVNLYEEYENVSSEKKYYENLKEDEKVLDVIWNKF